MVHNAPRTAGPTMGRCGVGAQPWVGVRCGADPQPECRRGSRRSADQPRTRSRRPPRGRSPDRTRGARAARRPAGDAGADPRHGPGRGRSSRAAAPRRSGPRWPARVVAVPASGFARRERSIAALPEHEVDGLAIDPLQPQLLADGPFAARPGPVARLHPGPRERLVVEHPELGHPRDRAIDEVRPIPGATETPPHL